MDEGNQVSGVYDGRLFSGVIQKTADVNGIQWIKVKLDTPLVTGRKKIKSLEIELNEQALVSRVARDRQPPKLVSVAYSNEPHGLAFQKILLGCRCLALTWPFGIYPPSLNGLFINGR